MRADGLKLRPVLSLGWKCMAGEGGSAFNRVLGVATPLLAEAWELLTVEVRVRTEAPAKGEAKPSRGEGIMLGFVGENAPNLIVAVLPAGMRVFELLELVAGEKIARGDCRLGLFSDPCCCSLGSAKGSGKCFGEFAPP